MSTAEVQIKIGSVADLSGIEKTKASLNGLQGELQKKLSAKGIGMSLLEGLGIGSGFRIADLLAEQLVKPFKDAAEAAERLAAASTKAADATASLMRYRKERIVGAEQAMKDDISALEKQLDDAQKKQSGKRYVLDGVDSNGDQTGRMEMFQTDADKAKVDEISASLQKATEQLQRYQDTAVKGAEDKTLQAATDAEMKRLKDISDAKRDNAQKSAELRNKTNDEAQAVRDSLDPLAKYTAEIKRLTDLETRGALSSADKSKAVAKLNAEFNRPEQIRQSAQALQGYENAIAAIEQNPLLTDKEKREAIREKLAGENEELRKQIKLWTDLNAVAPSADNQALIDGYNDKLRENGARGTNPASRLDQANMGARNLGDPSQHYQSIGDGAQGGLVEVLTSFGTLADQTADLIKTSIGGAVQSVTQNMMGWINGTQTFGRALRNIGASVFQSFIQQIIQMGVQWLITQGLIKAGLITTHATGEALKAASTTSTIAQESAKTPVLATNAGLASVSSFGVAAILGIALLVAGIAALAFESGGMIPGGEKLIRVNEAGQESVLNARATSTLGSAFVNAVNSGDFAAAQQMMNPLGGITRPGFSPEMQAGGAGAAQAAAAGSLNIGVRGFNAQHEINQWFESREGRKVLVNLIDGRVSHHA